MTNRSNRCGGALQVIALRGGEHGTILWRVPETCARQESWPIVELVSAIVLVAVISEEPFDSEPQ